MTKKQIMISLLHSVYGRFNQDQGVPGYMKFTDPNENPSSIRNTSFPTTHSDNGPDKPSLPKDSGITCNYKNCPNTYFSSPLITL